MLNESRHQRRHSRESKLILYGKREGWLRTLGNVVVNVGAIYIFI